MIPAKRNSNLVLVQHKVEVDGPYNPAVTWAENRKVWVSINPNRGREVFQGDELASVVTHTLRGDFLELEGITSEMRVIYNDTHAYTAGSVRTDSLVFDILAVMPNYDGRDDIMIQASLMPMRFGDLPPDIPQ